MVVYESKRRILFSVSFDCEGLFPGQIKFAAMPSFYRRRSIKDWKIFMPYHSFVLDENVQVRDKALGWPEAVCKG